MAKLTPFQVVLGADLGFAQGIAVAVQAARETGAVGR